MSFSSEPIVQIENACIFQEEKTVLNDLSLKIDKGEICIHCGPYR